MSMSTRSLIPGAGFAPAVQAPQLGKLSVSESAAFVVARPPLACALCPLASRSRLGKIVESTLRLVSNEDVAWDAEMERRHAIQVNAQEEEEKRRKAAQLMQQQQQLRAGAEDRSRDRRELPASVRHRPDEGARTSSPRGEGSRHSFQLSRAERDEAEYEDERRGWERERRRGGEDAD